MALLLAPGAGFAADYVAYAVVDGHRIPLPRTLAGISDRYLDKVAWGRASGRPVAVSLDPVTAAVSGDAAAPSETIGRLLDHTLAETGRFRVVAPKLAGTQGGHDAVRYRVRATVLDYRAEVGDGGDTGSLEQKVRGLLTRLGVVARHARVALKLELLDPVSGSALYERKVGAEARLRAPGPEGDATQPDPALRQAARAAVNRGVFALVKEVANRAVKGHVVLVKGSSVYLDLGPRLVGVGDRLRLIAGKRGAPAPGKAHSKSVHGQQIGVLEIRQVRGHYSVARPVGVSPLQVRRDDRVISLDPAAHLHFAPRWQPPAPPKKHTDPVLGPAP